MFLEPSTSEVPKAPVFAPVSRRRRRWHFGLGVALIIVVVLLGCFYVGIAATRVVRGGIATRDSLLAAKEDIAETDFFNAQINLTAASNGVLEAQAGAEMLSFASRIPWIGIRYDATVGVLDATKNTIDVLADAVTIANDVYSVVTDARKTLAWNDPGTENTAIHDLPISVKRALFVRFADSLPDLQIMQVKLALASENIATFETLPETAAIGDLIAPFAEVVADLKTSVDFLVPFAGITREFAGLRGDRQFLLLFMNDTELRPTGGFLGSYGLLVIRDGDMKSLTTDDAYAVDALVAQNPAYAVVSPSPIAKYLEQPIWYFRDGTWSPDFPTGAQEAASLLRQEFAVAGQSVPQVDGVIGITTGFMEHLLDFVGPVTVNGITYDSQNAADFLEYQVEIAFEQQGIARSDRKDVLGELTNAVLDKLLEVSPSRFADVFALLSSGFADKDLALFSTDEDTQAILKDYGWSGTVAQGGANDFLMVIDANMASLKSDPVVKRSIAYTITPTTTGYQATAAITYDHQGAFDWKTSRYRTYTRIYVPAGAQLVSVAGSLANDAIRNPQGLPGEVTTTSEFGLMSFGTFTSIEPGQSRTLTFVYTLPKSIGDAVVRGSYRMRVIKQLGALGPEIDFHLDFNKKLRNALPAEASSAWGDDVYSFHGTLEHDQDFFVEF